MKPKPPLDLWEQMDAITGPPQEEMEGISAVEFAVRHKISDKTARCRLVQFVRDGKMIEGRRKASNNQWERVYRPK